MVVAVGHVVALTLELELLLGPRLANLRLGVAGMHDLRVRVDVGQWILPAGIWLGVEEQRRKDAQLHRYGVAGRYPVDVPLDLHAVRARRTRAGVGQILAVHLQDLAVLIAVHAGAAHDEAVPQPHELPRRQPEETLGRGFGKVLALDPEFTAQLEAALAPLGMVGMTWRAAGNPFGRVHVVDHQPDRIGDDVQPVDRRIQYLAHRLLQYRHVDQLVGLRHAGPLAEQPDGSRRITTPTQARDGRHAWIVPARHDALVHQSLQLALAGDGVGEVHPGKLDLPRQRGIQQAGFGHAGQQPVVQWPVILELQRAQRMGDPLQRIFQRMRIVVHRVDRPGIARAMVVCQTDPVQDRVAQVDVGRSHVDLRAQHHRAFRVFALPHLPEELQAFGHWTVAERRVAPRLGQRAAVLADLVAGLAVHIGVTGLDQLQRDLVEGLEVVAGVVQVALAIVELPVEAQPAHRIDDRVDVFLVFLFGIGVVETQVAAPRIVGCQLEVQADRLGVTDVQKAVGLGRKARADASRVGLALALHGGHSGAAGPAAPVELPAGQVGIHRLTDEVADRGCVRGCGRGRGFGRLHVRECRQPQTPSSSTSNSSVALGGITPPAPRAP